MPLVFTRPLDKKVWLKGHIISYFSTKTYVECTQNNCLHERGTQSLSGRVLDSRQRGRGFEPHRRHCVVSLSKNIIPSLVLGQPRKTRPFITGRLLKGSQFMNWLHTREPLYSNSTVIVWRLQSMSAQNSAPSC